MHSQLLLLPKVGPKKLTIEDYTGLRVKIEGSLMYSGIHREYDVTEGWDVECTAHYWVVILSVTTRSFGNLRQAVATTKQLAAGADLDHQSWCIVGSKSALATRIEEYIQKKGKQWLTPKHRCSVPSLVSCCYMRTLGINVRPSRTIVPVFKFYSNAGCLSAAMAIFVLTLTNIYNMAATLHKGPLQLPLWLVSCFVCMVDRHGLQPPVNC